MLVRDLLTLKAWIAAHPEGFVRTPSRSFELTAHACCWKDASPSDPLIRLNSGTWELLLVNDMYDLTNTCCICGKPFWSRRLHG